MERIKFLALIILIFCFLNACKEEKSEIIQSPPNIVFIMADDMGCGDPNCYNPNSKIPTPNIDRLAKNGMLFLDAHSPAAWCVPSRYGLMTGTYPARAKMNWREQSIISKGDETLATLFKRNGYATACVGKWHLGFDDLDWEHPENMKTISGGPTEKGFDYFFGMHASLDIPPYFYIENDALVESPTSFVEDNFSEDATSAISGAFWRKGAIAPDFKHAEVLDRFEEKAVSFIESKVKEESPFFLYLPLTAPHTPWLPKDGFLDQSGAGEYGDFVVQVDDLLGRMLSSIEKNGISENTIVVFTSDNGPVWFESDINQFEHNSKAGLKGMKIDHWEGGSKIPFIVSWPQKIPAASQSNQLICFTDMMATFASILGDTTLDLSQFDSHDLSGVFFGKEFKEPVRENLLIGDKIYRNGNYKLIKGSGLGGLSKTYDPDSIYLSEIDNEGELYDLSKDFAEQENLYSSMPELVEKLNSEMAKILEDK